MIFLELTGVPTLFEIWIRYNSESVNLTVITVITVNLTVITVNLTVKIVFTVHCCNS